MRHQFFSALIGVLALSSALAQGPGAGGGPGPGASSGDRGMHRHGGMMHPNYSFGNSNTMGWSMMSADERKAHHDKMMGMKSADECKAYHEEHHKMMESRAKEKGVKMPGSPRVDMCDHMQKRGHFDQKPKG
jgi:hypothetical protein